jgi:hypothetical protein
MFSTDSGGRKRTFGDKPLIGPGSTAGEKAWRSGSTARPEEEVNDQSQSRTLKENPLLFVWPTPA